METIDAPKKIFTVYFPKLFLCDFTSDAERDFS